MSLNKSESKAEFSFVLRGFFGVGGGALLLSLPFFAFAAFGDCAPGYRFDRMSGVGCVQDKCADVPSAHYSYEGYCICGSAGSINENPADPNKRCTLPHENAACPDCVYACVHINEECPAAPGAPAAPAPTPAVTADAPDASQLSGAAGEPAAATAGEDTGEGSASTQLTAEEDSTGEAKPPKTQEELIKELQSHGITPEQLSALLANDQSGGPVIVRAGIGGDISNVVKRGFGVIMEVIGWGTEKTIGLKIIQDQEDKTSGWAGLFIAPDGDYVDVKVFEGRLALSWDDGIGAEFNLISIKGRPNSNSFIDGFSIGIGPGSANKDEASPSIPGTPVSPNINVENIRNYFSEKWNDTKGWWNENVPWPLGGYSVPNIGGGN